MSAGNSGGIGPAMGKMPAFASTAPINDDPEPMEGCTTGKRYAMPFTANEAGETAYERPRPEFDRPRAHKANPILTEFRESIATIIGGWERIAMEAEWWLTLMTYDPEMRNPHYWGRELANVTPAQVAHARAVLTRLSTLN